MKKLIQAITLFLFALAISSLVGVNAFIGTFVVGGLVVATSVGLKNQNLAMLTGIDVDDLSTALGAYARKYAAQIQVAIFQDIEFENYMSKVPGITDTYAVGSATTSELIQPFQCGWQPKGETAFDAIINKVREGKIDHTLGCLDDLYRTYLSFLIDEGTTADKYPITKWIIFNMLIPQIKQEIDHNSYNGVYAAPTPGTAGASATMVDGIKKVNEDLIAAGRVTEITTGVITSSNVLDKVESFVDTMPVKYRDMPGNIYVSKTIARWYKRAYRDAFGTDMDFDSKNRLMVDATNKKLVGISSMEGSQRFVHTNDGNMIVMFDKNYIPNLRTQLDKRDVLVLGEFKRGYGYKIADSVFLNDQA